MRFPLFLCLLLSLSFLFHVNSQCLDDQKLLLLRLKQILPSNSSKLQSWVSSTDCCLHWDGIQCDRIGHVITLDLSNQSIPTTSIANSSFLFQLEHLEKLNLAYNNFNSMPIPMEFSGFVNLTRLNLSNSGFAGQIPISITQMKRLVSLDLSTNPLFVGQNPLKLENPDLRMLVGNLAGLQELYLDGVNISSHATEWCQALTPSSLPPLHKLSLSNCKLSGPFHNSLSLLNLSLSQLRLDLNNISAELPEFFGNFSNLTSLQLYSCGLRGKIPEKIFQLPRLQSLDISANPDLHGSLPEFPPNASLQNMVLSGTNFSGKLPDSIGNLKLLAKLEAPSCGFEGPIPKSMSTLTHLIYLDLSANSFNGSVPNLTLSENLSQINLAHNRLTGSIPFHWEKYRKLVNLNLRNNSLNGSIPPSLFSLPFLQKLELSQNQFGGQLGEFSNATSSLETVDIGGNKLEGPIPSSVFNLSGLKIFSVPFNKFNGTLLLDKFQKMRNLSSLDLSGNNLTVNAAGTDSALFPQVGTLKLSSCNLGSFPDFLKNQSTLNFLDLSNNGIGGRIPNWIGNIGNGALNHLNLSLNFLEDPEHPLPIGSFNSLAVVNLRSNRLQGPIPILPPSASVLDYSKNKLTSVIPSDIGLNLSVAVFFSISSNNFTGEIPVSMCSASYLQVLDLSNNNLNGSLPNCFGNMESLRVLNLRNNSFHGPIPEAPLGCSLRTLDLSRNRLEGEVTETLANCTRLEVLDLGNNRINGKFPSWLGKLPYLQVLVLRFNMFQGPIQHLEINTTSQMLQIIDLSSNNFTGTLPSDLFLKWKAMVMGNEEDQYKNPTLRFGVLEFSQIYYQDVVTLTSKGMQIELVKILTIFSAIDFSNNNFKGEIPEEVGNLTSVHALNLSRNALSGRIPSSLGNLKQIESLDLSRNKLSGAIPLQLTELTFLSALKLSFNELSGMIPTGRQFQTFNADSFEGNAGLCGFPLNRCRNSSNQGPPQISSPMASKSNIDFDWQFILAGLGFGAGAAFAIGPLLFWPKARKWHDKLVDRMLSILLPSTALVYDVWDDSKVHTDESLEEDNWEESTDGEENEGDKEMKRLHGRFCVYCSKLDIKRKRVIHDPKCNCHASTPIPPSSPAL